MGQDWSHLKLCVQRNFAKQKFRANLVYEVNLFSQCLSPLLSYITFGRFCALKVFAPQSHLAFFSQILRNSTFRIAKLYFPNQAMPKYTFCETLLSEWQTNLHFCETLLPESSSHYPHKNLTPLSVFSDKPVLLKVFDKTTHPLY